MNVPKSKIIGADYFKLLKYRESCFDFTESNAVPAQPPYLGRPGARATCPLCGNEETRVDQYGGYCCEDCGFNTGNGDVVEPADSDEEREPRDCCEAIFDDPSNLDDHEEE